MLLAHSICTITKLLPWPAAITCSSNLGGSFSCMMQLTGNVLILLALANQDFAETFLAKPYHGWDNRNLRQARLSCLPVPFIAYNRSRFQVPRT
jgi:hypothetical protein